MQSFLIWICFCRQLIVINRNLLINFPTFLLCLYQAICKHVKFHTKPDKILHGLLKLQAILFSMQKMRRCRKSIH